MSIISKNRAFRPKILEDSLDFDSLFAIPTSIFYNQDLSILEAIVKYLREKKNFKPTEIARVLGRSKKTIWTVENRSINKQLKIKKGEFELIPFHILQDRSLSVLESIIYFLRTKKNLSNSLVSNLLDRDRRNIAQGYKIALQKVGGDSK